MFCIYLRTNSDLCHLQHKLIGFYNRDEKCLQRGTDWVFKYSSLRFLFKGLTFYVICALLRPVFETIAQPSYAEASVLGKVPGNLRAIFMQFIARYYCLNNVYT